MEKKLSWTEESRKKLKEGVDELANAVGATLGPKGRNVIIERLFQSPYITKDGVTVAREIELGDPVQNMGAQMVKEVANKANKLAGDGTTTATVLAQAIFATGLKNVANGANPMALKKGIDKAVKVVVEHLKSQAIQVGDDINRIKQVASISANNDSEIGDVIAQAVYDVRKDGIVTIEEAKGTETVIRTVDGLQINKGYMSPYFITDIERQECIYDNPYILLCENKISLLSDIIPILKLIIESNRPLIIIAEDVEGEALASLVGNKLQGKLRVAAVKSPEFGELKREIMQDVATVTGGVYMSDERGYELKHATLQLLGEAEKVIIGKDVTTIVNGKGDKDEIQARISAIKKGIENATDERAKSILQQRAAKLSGGIAVIYVGAVSEVELKEKKDRFDDSLHATWAAIEEGIIPGGGVGYIRSIKSLDGLYGENEDENIGIAIIRKALEMPLRKIVDNAGISQDTVISKVMDGVGDYGFNARTEQYENLIESGVIDPVKVSRVAIENAASIASLMLTTECVIFIPDKKAAFAAMNQG